MNAWNNKDVCHWLISLGYQVEPFHDNQITGRDLAGLTHTELRLQFGIASFQQRKMLLAAIQDVLESPPLPVPSTLPNYDPLGLSYLNCDPELDELLPLYGDSDTDDLEELFIDTDEEDQRQQQLDDGAVAGAEPVSASALAVEKIIADYVAEVELNWHETQRHKLERKRRQLWFRLRRFKADLNMEVKELEIKRLAPLVATIKSSGSTARQVKSMCGSLKESIYLRCELNWKVALCSLPDAPFNPPSDNKPVTVKKPKVRTEDGQELEESDDFTDDFIASDDDELDQLGLEEDAFPEQEILAAHVDSDNLDEPSQDEEDDEDYEPETTPVILPRKRPAPLSDTDSDMELEAPTMDLVEPVHPAEENDDMSLSDDLAPPTLEVNSAPPPRTARTLPPVAPVRKEPEFIIKSPKPKPAEISFSCEINPQYLNVVHACIPETMRKFYTWNSAFDCKLFHIDIYVSVAKKLSDRLFLSHNQKLGQSTVQLSNVPLIFMKGRALLKDFKIFRQFATMDAAVRERFHLDEAHLDAEKAFGIYCLFMEMRNKHGPSYKVPLKALEKWLATSQPLKNVDLPVRVQDNELYIVDRQRARQNMASKDRAVDESISSFDLKRHGLGSAVIDGADDNSPVENVETVNDVAPQPAKKSRKEKSKFREFINRIEQERQSVRLSGDISVNINRRDDTPPVYFPQFLAKGGGVNGEQPALKDHQVDGVRFLWNCLCEIGYSEGTGGCILAHSMGLGKTLQVIAFVYILYRTIKYQREALPKHLQLDNLRVLIITPASLLDNWHNELDKWLPAAEDRKIIGKIYTCSKDPVKRLADLQLWHQRGGILLISFETYRILTEDPNSAATGVLQYPGADLVICDEAHRIKNPNAIITTALNKVKTLNRVCLTGYPLQNNLEEYYTMMDFVRPGSLGELHEFKSRFSIPITEAFSADSDAQNLKFGQKRLYVLHKLLDPFVFRLDIKDPRNNTGYSKLLVKHYAPIVTTRIFDFVIKLRISKLQFEIYSALIGGSGGTSGDLGNSRLLERISELRRVVNHPARLSGKRPTKKEKKKAIASTVATAETNGSRTNPIMLLEEDDANDIQEEETAEAPGPEHINPAVAEVLNKYTDLSDLKWTAKIRMALRIIEKTFARKEKILFFSEFLYTLDYVQELLERHASKIGFVRLDGSVAVTKRQKIVDNFNNTAAITVFLISIKAGGLGLNCQAANRVIIFDSNFNPCHNEQAIARAYRCGQKKDVFVYRLCVYDTVDDILYRKAKQKTGLSRLVVDKKKAVDIDFCKDELKQYFRIPDIDRQATPHSAALTYLHHDSLLASIYPEFKNDVIELTPATEFGEMDVDLQQEDQEDADKLLLLEKSLYSERVRLKPAPSGPPVVVSHLPPQQDSAAGTVDGTTTASTTATQV